MKKRGLSLLLILCLFALSSNVYSVSEESVFSGTVKDREVKNISGSVFEFRIDSLSSKIVVEIGSSGMIIENGNCRIKGGFNVCLTNISFSHKNLTTYMDIYQATVQVYKNELKSSLSVVHSIDKSSILIDEEATVELSVENTGEVAAKDFSAAIHIPNSILVMGAEGCQVTFDSIIFKEDVHPNQVKKCIYNIRGLSGGEFDLTANASYFDGRDVLSLEPSVSAKVHNYSLKISSDLNKSAFGINEKFNLTITAKNINDQHGLTVTTFRIEIPSNTLLVGTPADMIKTNRALSWGGSLGPGEEKSFVVDLLALRTGNYSVAAEASYKISRFLRRAEHKSAVHVICDCPYISREVFPGRYATGDRINMDALLVNPNNLSFSNIRIAYSTNIPGFQDFSTSHPKINPKESIGIFSSSFLAPEAFKSYYFNITASYSSEYNEVFSVKERVIVRLPEKGAASEEELAKDDESILEQAILEESISGSGELAEESGKHEPEEEIPAIILENGSRDQFKKYVIAGIIAAVMFGAAVLVIFKRKLRKKHISKTKRDFPSPKPAEKISAPAKEKGRSVKEVLHLDLLRKENNPISAKAEKEWERDGSYREIEKQIAKLGIQAESREKKKGFWPFRKK